LRENRSALGATANGTRRVPATWDCDDIFCE
jgi:hypothetical protein